MLGTSRLGIAVGVVIWIVVRFVIWFVLWFIVDVGVVVFGFVVFIFCDVESLRG